MQKKFDLTRPVNAVLQKAYFRGVSPDQEIIVKEGDEDVVILPLDTTQTYFTDALQGVYTVSYFYFKFLTLDQDGNPQHYDSALCNNKVTPIVDGTSAGTVNMDASFDPYCLGAQRWAGISYGTYNALDVDNPERLLPGTLGPITNAKLSFTGDIGGPTHFCAWLMQNP